MMANNKIIKCNNLASILWDQDRYRFSLFFITESASWILHLVWYSAGTMNVFMLFVFECVFCIEVSGTMDQAAAEELCTAHRPLFLQTPFAYCIPNALGAQNSGEPRENTEQQKVRCYTQDWVSRGSDSSKKPHFPFLSGIYFWCRKKAIEFLKNIETKEPYHILSHSITFLY